MGKNKKIIVIVVTVITLLFVISSATYAYWQWYSSNAQKTNVTFTASPTFSCSANVGEVMSSQNVTLAPTVCTDSDHAIKKEIIIDTSITGNDNAYLDMILKVNSIDSGLSGTNNFKYALTRGSTSCTDNVINDGNFSGATVNTEKELLHGVPYYSTTANDTYYLWIWLDAAETSSSSQNQSFDFSITGSCSSQIPSYTLPTQITTGAVMDNISSTYVSNSNGIQFNAISSDTNGKGVYIRSGTERDANPIYYYRGNVTNNNVLFANYCWKIVRTTETGGIKLIYNGSPSNGQCNNTGNNSQLATTMSFNDGLVGNSIALGEYMYSTYYSYSSFDVTTITGSYKFSNTFTYSNGTYTLSDNDSVNISSASYNISQLNNHHYTCLNSTGVCDSIKYFYAQGDPAEYLIYITITNGKSIEDVLDEVFINHGNTNSSTIKTAIDNWYSTNMTSYTSKIEDTPWCNDTSIGSYGGFNPNGGSITDMFLFSSAYRLFNGSTPVLFCARNYAYTVNNNSFGNGALTYPVGLLTAEEALLVGSTASNSNNYLKTGNDWYLMTPVGSPYLGIYFSGKIDSNGAISPILGSAGVRPAISLKPGINFISGDGSGNSPYIVE